MSWGLKRPSSSRLSARRTAMQIGPPLRSPAANPSNTPRHRSAVVVSFIAHAPGLLDRAPASWVRSRTIRNMTADAPLEGAARMTLPYTHFSDLAKEVQPPDKGILSRTLHNDDRLQVMLFGFTAPDREGCP